MKKDLIDIVERQYFIVGLHDIKAKFTIPKKIVFGNIKRLIWNKGFHNAMFKAKSHFQKTNNVWYTDRVAIM